MNFGQFAAQKRRDANLSQAIVAEAMGFQHRSEVSRKEAGLIEWKLNEVFILADLLGVKPSVLLAEYERQLEQM